MRFLRKLYYFVCRVLGSTIIDYRSGKQLGSALLIIWQGRVYVLGYTGEKELVVMWKPESKLRYTHSSIVFTTKGLQDE